MTQKYAEFNNDGFPMGFYDDGIHKDIPKKAIKITNEQWQEFIDNQGQRIWKNGAVVEYVPSPEIIAERNRISRIAQIQSRLAQIDIESIRPIRAIQKNVGTKFDTEKLENLEIEAETLREELRGLNA